MKNLKHLWLVAATLAGAPGCAVEDGSSVESQAVLSGLSASQIRDANKITSLGPSNQVIAILGVGAYPNALADLTAYRAAQGLPTLSSGQFTKIDQNGNTPSMAFQTNFAKEQAKLLMGASVGCPSCQYLLIEGTDSQPTTFAAQVDRAVISGATVTASQLIVPPSGAAVIDPHIAAAPISMRFAFGAGDAGFQSVAPYPARIARANVFGVGGTSLTSAPTTLRGWTESAWASGGAGCDTSVTKPSYESGTFCAGHSTVALAGVAQHIQGRLPTSVSTSVDTDFDGTAFAVGLVAGERLVRDLTFDQSALNALVPAKFFDVPTGIDGTCGTAQCQAQVGVDGPTYLGTLDMTGL